MIDIKIDTTIDPRHSKPKVWIVWDGVKLNLELSNGTPIKFI